MPYQKHGAIYLPHDHTGKFVYRAVVKICPLISESVRFISPVPFARNLFFYKEPKIFEFHFGPGRFGESESSFIQKRIMCACNLCVSRLRIYSFIKIILCDFNTVLCIC